MTFNIKYVKNKKLFYNILSMNILWMNIWETNNWIFLKDWWTTLISNWKIISSVAEERISRKKHDWWFYKSMDFILQENNISIKDIDLFVISTLGESTNLKIEDIKYLKKLISLNWWVKNIHIIPSHHLSHAYSVFPLSPYNEAIIVVADMEWSIIWDKIKENHWENRLERVSYFLWKKNEKGISIELIDRDFDSPDVVWIWEMYWIFTHYLWFESYVNSWKTMWLAPYWNIERFKNLKLFDFDSNWKPFSLIPNDYYNSNSTISKFFRKNWYKNIKERLVNSEITDIHKDVAFFVQNELERIMLKRINDQIWKFNNKIKNICFSWWVALNCVLNSKILSLDNVDSVFLQPACWDTWQSLWNAIYWDVHLWNNTLNYNFSPYLWWLYSENSIMLAIKNSNYNYKYLSDNELNDTVSDLLINNNIIWWFQWRSEVWPRALWNRSILANPISKDMKSIINERVKHREEFRPFAPIVLEEYMNDYFETNLPSPYMLFAPDIIKSKQIIIPSVTHIDWSSRLQTVSKNQNKKIYDLITKFYNKTWVPVLLNTSLNDWWDPLVESPTDAINCFSKTWLDYLVIWNFLISKK